MNLIVTMVGASFRPAEAKELVKALSLGDSVSLVPDGDNPYDDHAVQVCVDDVHVGFVPKTDNGPLFEALEAGAEYTAEVVGFENSLKPVIEIDVED